MNDCSCNRVTEEGIPNCVSCGDNIATHTADYKAYCYDCLVEYLVEQYATESVDEEEICIECNLPPEECDCEELCSECFEEDCICDEECEECGCNCLDGEDCCSEGYVCECGCKEEEE